MTGPREEPLIEIPDRDKVVVNRGTHLDIKWCRRQRARRRNVSQSVVVTPPKNGQYLIRADVSVDDLAAKAKLSRNTEARAETSTRTPSTN